MFHSVKFFSDLPTKKSICFLKVSRQEAIAEIIHRVQDLVMVSSKFIWISAQADDVNRSAHYLWYT